MDCNDDLQTRYCDICNSTHEVGAEYPSLEGADVCPMVLELNRKLLEACLEPTPTHPSSFAAPAAYAATGCDIQAPPIQSYADYLFRKAYFSDKPLRPDEQWKLDKLLKEKDRGLIAKKAWKNRKTKLERYDERERLRRLDMGYRYDYLLDVWKMASIPVSLSKEEFVSVVMGSFMVSYVYPWMGTIAEYIRDTRDGGRGGSIRLERMDTRLPLQLGNIQLCENVPKEMRKNRKATVEIVCV